VTAEQLVVLGLLVAAFVAGWVARGGREEDEVEEPRQDDAAPAPPPAARKPALWRGRTGAAAAPSEPAPRGTRPDPVHDAERALSLAAAAYETAVDRWLDERDAITPAGRAAVGAVEQAVQRLDVAAARLDESDAPDATADAVYDAVRALRDAARRLDAFRQGQAMDAATSRELDAVDDVVARARAAFA
jgi:hypothetical protein